METSKGVVVFMINECLLKLSIEGFRVRAVVTDNHSSNVAAFKILLTSFDSTSLLQFQHLDSTCITYLFFDTVHLFKNIRNNLINSKIFGFPSFSFNINDVHVSLESG